MSKIKLIPHKTYGKPKTYTDLKIALIKERGILNVWRDYCNKNGNHIEYFGTGVPRDIGC